MLADLTGIEIDLAKNEVRTPFGIMREYKELHPEQSVVGVWDGVQWKLVKGTTNIFTTCIVKLAVGKEQQTNRAILYYNAQKAYGLSSTRISLLIRFELPTSELSENDLSKDNPAAPSPAAVENNRIGTR